MKNILLFLYLLFSTLFAYSQAQDTFEVYFPFNDPKLTNDAKGYIDQMVFKDILIHGDKLIVLGYADYVGGNGHNDTLSKLRAKNVRNYLMTMGFDKNDVTICLGKGKIDRTSGGSKDGYAPDRKVQIIIDRIPGHTDTPKPAKPIGKFDLDNLKINQPIVLKNINFVDGKSDIMPESSPALQELYDFLKDHPTVKIRIEGHICCHGNAEGIDDGSLSLDRAIAIAKYLVGRGINTERIRSAGLGNLNPIVKVEKTEEDRKLNRRVEIRILSK